MSLDRVRISWRRASFTTWLALGGLFLSLLINVFGPVAPVAAASNGSILVWGDNRSNQLGLGVQGTQRATPGSVTAATGSGMAAIAAGGSYTLALKDDGTVLSWGSNFPAGQTGQGSTADRLDPAPVLGVSGVTAIAAGRLHGLAVSGGTVYAWGDNTYGELGTVVNGSCNSGVCSRTAVPVPGLSGVVAVGAGARNSFAVRNDGSLFSWGSNTGGALGDGTTTQRATPVAVKGIGGTGTLTGVKQVVGGEAHALALLNDGTVAAWGQNTQGQLGLGAPDQNNHPNPALVPGLNNIVAVAAGYRHSLALRADGAVFAWGFNDGGQLGNGTVGSNACSCVGAPAQVGGLAGVSAIGAGDGHSLAIVNDGTVRAWGGNGTAQTGSEGQPAITTPAVVPGVKHATAVAGAGSHSVVLQVAPQVALSVGTDGTGTGSVTPGSGSYPEGAQVTLTAKADPGSIFVGWKVNNQVGSWGNPLTLTLNANTSVVATFNKPLDFCDVNPNDPYVNAIQQLSARGIIRGFEREDGKLCFAPNEGTKRAQMAALIARPLGWDLEDHGNPFSDQGSFDNDLWRNVGTLGFYGVATGYRAETCVALGLTAPCYGPGDEVSYAQTVSFIARGMIAKGYWQRQPENPALYPNIPGDSGHRGDISTFVHYAGALPGTNATADWNGWDQPANRGWFAEAEWRALNSYFGLSR